MNTLTWSTAIADEPLHLDICQRIHYGALRKAAYQQGADRAPETVSPQRLQEQARWHGPDVYLIHPAEIEVIFAGVTLAAYRTIETLYVSRLGRSIRTVWEILQRQAEAEDAAYIDYEAIWAICMHLDERRNTEMTVTMERQDTTWIVAQLHPDVLLQDDFGEPYRPHIVCVIETPTDSVLAFRMSKTSACATTISFALYDAFAAQRQPGTIVDAVAGLHWSLPTTIATDRLVLPPDCTHFCADLAVDVVPLSDQPQFLIDLQGGWDRDLANRVLTPEHFTLIFDTYLRRFYGYGPHTTNLQEAHEHAHLTGYNRDPAWQFPALRRLLPAQSDVVAEDGSVACAGLHFEDDILSPWAGQQVTVRRSLHSDAAAYVYVDDEILCLAMARELRRADGRYRTHLPERMGR
jgi:hypothetical protein